MATESFEPTTSENATKGKSGNSRKGFASMSPEKRKKVARKGGRKAQRNGKAHRFNSAEAKRAGEKGGRVVSSKPGHMETIGRIGGFAKAGKLVRAIKSKGLL